VNVLWITTRIMFPLDQGGRIRTYHTLRHLSRKHSVAVVTLAVLPGEATSIPAVSHICRDLHVVPFRQPARRGSLRNLRELAANQFSRWPYSLARYWSRLMQREVARLLRDGMSAGPVDLVVCDYLTPAVNLPKSLDVPLVLFAHNVEAMIWDRLASPAEGGAGALRRRLFRQQARRMRRAESELARRAALVITISPDDRETFRREYGIQHVADVPTGVDTEYFAADRDLPDEPHIVFIGSMDWMPNEDGALFLLREALPRIRQSVPGARVTIVGKSPSALLRRAAQEAGNAAVTGRVDDVRPYLARARAVVVPLRVGGGTRIKIYEALAAGRPVVSTTIGAEGLPLTHGENVLLADTAPDFAEAVVQVLTDDALAQRLAEAGRQLVEERFDWSVAGAAFASLLEKVKADNRSGRRP
jgi:sugar transferase (PEP-CTERM/EpsH1 system associated)